MCEQDVSYWSKQKHVCGRVRAAESAGRTHVASCGGRTGEAG